LKREKVERIQREDELVEEVKEREEEARKKEKKMQISQSNFFIPSYYFSFGFS
jgi:hypothetical protein